MNQPIGFLVSIIVAVACRSHAQQLQIEKVDQYLGQCYERLSKATPGFAVALIHDDQIVFAKGYGVEVAGGDRPFSPDSVCPVGSLTKSFTALAMMQLAERKKVNLDTPVIKYLPWFRTADHQRSDRITVRMLLCHTSGIPSWDEWMPAEGIADQAMEQAIRTFSGRKTSHEPGRSFEYANEGYTVAGLIIQQVTGQSYCDYLQHAVLDPLKMKRSTADEQRLKQMAALTGHSPGIDRATPSRLPYIAAAVPGGSTFASTARDCGQYLIALMHKGRFRDARIIEQESIEQMMSPAIDFPCPLSVDDGGDRGTWHYGLGWMISQIDGRRVVGHEGDTGLAGSIAMIDPDKVLAVCIIRNSSDVDRYRFPTLITMANNVLHLAVGEATSDFGISRKPDPTINDFRPRQDTLQQCIGTYVSQNGPGRIKIAPHPNGDGLFAVSTGANVPIEEIVDFRDESLFVLRSLRGGRRGHFRKLPNGPMVGLQLGAEKFRKLSIKIPDGYREIRSPDSRSFVLPERWSIDWQGSEFTAADSADPQITLHGGTAMRVDSPLRSLADASREKGPVVEDGPIMSSAINGLVWHQHSSIVMQGDAKSQRLIVYTRLEDRVFFIVLNTPFGSLTNEAQRVVAPLTATFGDSGS